MSSPAYAVPASALKPPLSRPVENGPPSAGWVLLAATDTVGGPRRTEPLAAAGGKPLEPLFAKWKKDCEAFRLARKKYLLY